jgi:hypothetical protein
VVEHLLSMQDALDSSPSTIKMNKYIKVENEILKLLEESMKT